MNALVAGEELRCDPNTVDFSAWMRKEVLGLPHERPLRFPVSFDRSVWPRPEDMDTNVRDKATARNLLELTVATDCEHTQSDGWRISATLLTFRGPVSQAFRRAREAEAAADAWRMPHGWTLLGYDVLDSGLAMSGLLNCGSRAVETARGLLEKHNAKVNCFGLWVTPELASEFAANLDHVVADHAPFEVVGLYVCRSSLLLDPIGSI